MGIKNFKRLLEKCPQAVSNVPLRKFRGRRICLDASNIYYTIAATAWKTVVNNTKYLHETPNMEKFKRLWIKSLKSHVERFLMAGVTPIYVFEGKAPETKRACQLKRRESRERDEAKFSTLFDQLTEAQNLDEIRKVASRLIPYSPESIQLMRILLDSIGIPTLKGEDGNEGEKICANLCLEGYASAMFSTDRDSLVHGCPILITKFLGSRMIDGSVEEVVEILELGKILVGLDLSFDQFSDVCIMSGCDYNQNIPRKGAITSFKLIKKHSSIENLPEEYQELVAKHLNVNICRHEFSRVPVSRMLAHDFPLLRVDSSKLKNIRQFSSENFTSEDIFPHVEDWLIILNTFYQFLPIPKDLDVTPRSPPDYRRSRGRGVIICFQINHLSVSEFG